MNIAGLFAAFALLFPVDLDAQSASTCVGAFTDSISVRTLRALDQVAAIPPVWDDYTVARHPILLVADSAYRGNPSTPVCAAIWRNDRPLERIELAVRPALATPLYGMISSEPVGPGVDSAQQGIPQAHPAVAAALRDRGVTRVVFFNVPLDFGAMGRLGEMLRNANANPALIQADLAVHESFHLHVQFPVWLKQPTSYAWPPWDLQPDRAEVRQRCYAGTPELVSAFAAEQEALVAAFDAATGAAGVRDSAAAVRLARRVVELRAARRALQDTITITHGAGRTSCGRAEDLMELEEGSAQWIGHATTLRAGLRTMQSLRGTYAGSQPDRFYQTGPLLWWILDGLLGRETVHRLTAAMARSSGPDGPDGSVFAQFDLQTRLLAERRR